MEFSPTNEIVKRCLQGMSMEDKGQAQEALNLFSQAWEESTNDFERFLAAYYVARHQKTVSDKLKWLETALTAALKINDKAVESALPSLYSGIAKCYEELQDLDSAKKNHELADSFKDRRSDRGPFYHGTKANLQIGDLLTAGFNSNYQPKIVMNHIYFTALINGASLAAAMARAEGEDRIYIVEPMGSFENDPNVTDKKFPGNPTRSYRSQEPLKVLGEVKEWVRLSPEERHQWQQKIASTKGEIIN
ncbi:NAD(+)--rifampin ADP-ribosyltransferase [Olivibacter sp. CPCC 100613]